MGLFDLFARRPALSEGLEQYRNTSGAVLLAGYSVTDLGGLLGYRGPLEA